MKAIRLRATLALVLSLAAPLQAGRYRDYTERSVPKAPDKRRFAVALSMGHEAVEHGSVETRMLAALLFARALEVSSAELLPRMFVNPDESFLWELRSFEVDDLVRLEVTMLQAPPAEGSGPRPYRVTGTLSLVNVRMGTIVAAMPLVQLKPPPAADYADAVDQQTATLAALASAALSFYQGNAAAAALTPRCAAVDAAEDAEKAGRWEEAARILDALVKRSPADAVLKDRRDVAQMRAGRPRETAGGAAAGAPPGRGTDFLGAGSRGKVFPVSQGNQLVKERLPASFSVSVNVLLKDENAHGGILVGSKNKNIFVSVAPSSKFHASRITVENLNLVTGVTETREVDLGEGAFTLGKASRLEVRYDGGDMSVMVDGKQAFMVSKLNLDRPSVSFFGKLSTVYFQDAVIYP